MTHFFAQKIRTKLRFFHDIIFFNQKQEINFDSYVHTNFNDIRLHNLDQLLKI